MRMSFRVTVFLVIIAVTIASVVAATAAFAASAPEGGDGAHTLRLHTILVSSVVNDAGHGGPGDVTALLFDIQTPPGHEAGKAHISCTTITPDVQLCHAAFVLAPGQIEAQASIPMTATTFDAAIIGGTGAYEGVSGQIHNVVQGPGVIDRTFHLITPHNR